MVEENSARTALSLMHMALALLDKAGEPGAAALLANAISLLSDEAFPRQDTE